MQGASGKRFNKIKGDYGEALAIGYLRERGYKIVETNYKNRLGEIDIIAKKNKVLHFIEVKYRRTTEFGHGRDSVGYNKQLRIKNAANLYLTSTKLMFRVNSCFDIIEIHETNTGTAIEHLVNCFQ